MMLQSRLSLHTRAVSRRPICVSAAKGFGQAKSKAPSTSIAPQTCPCGSKLVYRECCEPLHTGNSVASSAEATLKARFSAFTKGEVKYLVATDMRTETAVDQRRRDSTYACNNRTYSGLKLLQFETVEKNPDGDSQWLKFQYNYTKQPRANKASNNKSVKIRGEEADRNIDGSIRQYTTVERSKFTKTPEGSWVLVESETLSTDPPPPPKVDGPSIPAPATYC